MLKPVYTQGKRTKVAKSIHSYKCLIPRKGIHLTTQCVHGNYPNKMGKTQVDRTQWLRQEHNSQYRLYPPQHTHTSTQTHARYLWLPTWNGPQQSNGGAWAGIVCCFFCPNPCNAIRPIVLSSLSFFFIYGLSCL